MGLLAEARRGALALEKIAKVFAAAETQISSFHVAQMQAAIAACYRILRQAGFRDLCWECS